MREQWDKLLQDDDEQIHLRESFENGEFEIMNPRRLQFEELWAGMPAYYFVQTGKHCGVQYKAVVLIPTPDEAGRIGCAVQSGRGEWKPMFVVLSDLRHREQVVS